MIKYYHDHTEDITIAFYCVDLPGAKMAKKAGALLGYAFEEVDVNDMKENIYEDLSFKQDTLIIERGLFVEDLLDLLEYGIYVYILDY